ncbi:MAG: hypothetical protein QM783_13740 [Phycisphaerales bacterium]
MSERPLPSQDPRGPWAQSGMGWRQRFGYYFIGIAISLLLMGLYFSYVKPVRDQARREMEARNAGKPLPVPGVPLNPEPAKK